MGVEFVRKITGIEVGKARDYPLKMTDFLDILHEKVNPETGLADAYVRIGNQYVKLTSGDGAKNTNVKSDDTLKVIQLPDGVTVHVELDNTDDYITITPPTSENSGTWTINISEAKFVELIRASVRWTDVNNKPFETLDSQYFTVNGDGMLTIDFNYFVDRYFKWGQLAEKPFELIDADDFEVDAQTKTLRLKNSGSEGKILSVFESRVGQTEITGLTNYDNVSIRALSSRGWRNTGQIVNGSYYIDVPTDMLPLQEGELIIVQIYDGQVISDTRTTMVTVGS